MVAWTADTTMPDPFDVVVGQDRAVAAMRAAAEAPVHAYLLVGPRGSGKRDLARAFAAALLSASSTGGASSGMRNESYSRTEWNSTEPARPRSSRTPSAALVNEAR